MILRILKEEILFQILLLHIPSFNDDTCLYCYDSNFDRDLSNIQEELHC